MRPSMKDTDNQSNLPILTMPFRHFSDISYALLCIIGRNRNERRLFSYINHLLTLAPLATNRAVGSSNLSGRAIFSKLDQAVSASCASRFFLQNEQRGTIVGPLTIYLIGNSDVEKT